MWIKYEKRFLRYSLYIFLLASAIGIVYKVLDNIPTIVYTINNFIKYICKILLPFIIGFTAAYLFNPYVMWVERNLIQGFVFKKIKKEKYKRMISILLIYIIVLGLLTLGIIYIAPKVVKSVRDVVKHMPDYFIQLDSIVNDLSSKYEFDKMYDISKYVDKYINMFISRYNMQNIEMAINSVMRGVLNVTTVFLHYILGFIISFYLLMEKENFRIQLKRFMRALFKDETVEAAESFAMKVNEIFSKFIIGKAIDSVIIGILCFIGLVILNVRYSLLISVIIAITNMIPYFGPFIGAIPAILITLFDGPIKALWVAIFILVLQQFDGMVLGPKILGNSTGLDPFWIIFAIIIGGGLFGFVGMFLGVPVIAVIKLLLTNYIDKKIMEKETG